MVVPVGKQVKLIITGADVIHSFAVPALWTKMDAVPGRANETTFTIDKPGVFYGQCSELCGVDHGYMPIAVEALPMDTWKAWRSEERRVGKECVRTCRSRVSPSHSKQTIITSIQLRLHCTLL